MSRIQILAALGICTTLTISVSLNNHLIKSDWLRHRRVSLLEDVHSDCLCSASLIVLQSHLDVSELKSENGPLR